MLLGIDIGGTTINLGLVKDNQIVHKITVPSFVPDATLEETLQHLEKAFNIPIAVNNDANCFVLGAAALLDKPSSVIVGVTLGTGTGVGIIIDGKLFTGTVLFRRAGHQQRHCRKGKQVLFHTSKD